MARVIYGGVGLQGLSGSINKQAGGHTFTKNNVVRRRVVPVNPQTASQQAIRAAFLFFTTAWSQTLTEPQRQAWETARNDVYYQKQDSLTGTSRKYGSGKDLFIAMNMNWLQASDAIGSPAIEYLVPGTSAGIDTVGSVAVAIDASSGTVAVTFTGSAVLENLVFKATQPVSAGTMRNTSIKSKFRYVLGAQPTSPWALGSPYTAIFGAITGAAGQKVFWTVEGVDILTGKTRLVASGDSVIAA